MPYYFSSEAELQSIANAIRTKGGTSGQLVYPDGFITAINNIEAKVQPTANYAHVDFASATSSFPPSSQYVYSATKSIAVDKNYVYVFFVNRMQKEYDSSGYTGKYTTSTFAAYFLTYTKDNNNIARWYVNNSQYAPDQTEGIHISSLSPNKIQYTACANSNVDVSIRLYQGPKIA